IDGVVELQNSEGHVEELGDHRQFPHRLRSAAEAPDAGRPRDRPVRNKTPFVSADGCQRVVWDRHPRSNEDPAFEGGLACTSPFRVAVPRNDHRRPLIREIYPPPAGGDQRDSVAIRDMVQEIDGHLLTIDLCPIIIERHQQERREGVGFFLPLPFRFMPRTGPQGFALEIGVAIKEASRVVAAGQGRAMKLIMTEFMRDGESDPASIAPIVVVDDMPFRPLLMGPEHTLEPRQITAHNLANRVVVVPRHLTGKSFDVHWKTVLSQNMTKQDRETVRLLLRGFPLSITHQSSSKASSIRRRRSFAGASIFLYFRKNAMSSASSSFSPSPASRYSTVVSSAVAIRASFSA